MTGGLWMGIFSCTFAGEKLMKAFYERGTLFFFRCTCLRKLIIKENTILKRAVPFLDRRLRNQNGFSFFIYFRSIWLISNFFFLRIKCSWIPVHRYYIFWKKMFFNGMREDPKISASYFCTYFSSTLKKIYKHSVFSTLG